MDKLQRLKQGSSRMEEYRQSMELLMMRAGIMEEERITISRFQSCLNLEIRDKVELLLYRDLNELVQLCYRVEHQFKRKTLRKDSTPSYSKSFKKEGPSSKPFPNEKEKEGKTSQRTSSKETKTSDIKCFKCLGRGHIASQFPTKKTMILKGQDHYSSIDEATSSSSSDEEEILESEEETYRCEGDLLMVRRLLGNQSSDLDQTQRENLFYALSRRHALLSTLGTLLSFDDVKELYELDLDFQATYAKCLQKPFDGLCLLEGYSKLNPRGNGQFHVLHKINDNAYKLDLPSEYGISSSFNECDLTPFLGAEDMDEDSNLRTDASQEGGDDGRPSLRTNVGLITRSMARRVEEEEGAHTPRDTLLMIIEY
uniref:Tf2-1-like SH3-like domain-containing protein n=1 Tax=Cajanus cajan TaxID=3821 RepID=A0A151RKQ0_CAJCA|nr:hypothetical protein KK1_035418 [Cajanus cajan]